MLSFEKSGANLPNTSIHPIPNSRLAKKKTAFKDLRSRPGLGPEISVTQCPLPGEGIMEFFTRLADTLDGATIVNLLGFGSAVGCGAATEAIRRIFGKVEWPVTWVEGRAGEGALIAGIQVTALGAGDAHPIRIGERVVGTVFEHGSARHCLLGNLGPMQPLASRPDQTKQTLESLNHALESAGFSLSDTVRTWFFLEDILSWYEDFNRARSQMYAAVNFKTGSLPASTGVGAQNPAGTALVLGARAMTALDAAARAIEVASPLQCPAPAYGSSFSRAMEISTATARQLLISGTASIAPGGETRFPTDVSEQVNLTMDVIAALLDSCGFSFADLTRVVAYFKDATNFRLLEHWCKRRGLSALPAVSAQCDICREDLLFELEADAFKSGSDRES
jgi:enamine deaminase RidA (YjgF/YER057c/UK114 family)